MFKIKISNSIEINTDFFFDWTINKSVFRKKLTAFEKKFDLSIFFEAKKRQKKSNFEFSKLNQSSLDRTEFFFLKKKSEFSIKSRTDIFFSVSFFKSMIFESAHFIFFENHSTISLLKNQKQTTFFLSKLILSITLPLFFFHAYCF